MTDEFSPAPYLSGEKPVWFLAYDASRREEKRLVAPAEILGTSKTDSRYNWIRASYNEDANDVLDQYLDEYPAGYGFSLCLPTPNSRADPKRGWLSSPQQSSNAPLEALVGKKNVAFVNDAFDFSGEVKLNERYFSHCSISEHLHPLSEFEDCAFYRCGLPNDLRQLRLSTVFSGHFPGGAPNFPAWPNRTLFRDCAFRGADASNVDSAAIVDPHWAFGDPIVTPWPCTTLSVAGISVRLWRRQKAIGITLREKPFPGGHFFSFDSVGDALAAKDLTERQRFALVEASRVERAATAEWLDKDGLPPYVIEQSAPEKLSSDNEQNASDEIQA